MNSRHIETQIIRRAVEDTITAGHDISVHDYEHYRLRRSKDTDRVMSQLFVTDVMTFEIRDQAGAHTGYVEFTHGKGVDVITDYASNCRTVGLLNGALNLADEIELT